MRGIFDAYMYLGRKIGIIPAGAGHLQAKEGDKLVTGDHPRRCGAFLDKALKRGRPEGSSPQVRGICLFLGFRCRKYGIIPAGAGHLVARLRRRRRFPDHPRRCGAFLMVVTTLNSVTGSSPQVRGIWVIG